MISRIKKVRKDAGKSQAEFAEDVGLTKNFISLIENGQRNLSDRTISDICRVYSVNEDWLRTGQGEPYTLEAVERQTAEYLGHAISHNCTSKDAFLRAIAAADDETIAAVIEFMKMCVAELEKQNKP